MAVSNSGMKFPSQCLFVALLGVTLVAPLIFSARAADDALAWPPITSQTRPWAFWWWMGSAVDQTNLTKELTRYHEAGLGGVHIIPIYGAKGWEDKYIQYLSPEWMAMMGWSVSEAHRLGMGVDMTLGTGWCFGGPTVRARDANASVVVETYHLAAGEKLTEEFNRAATQALMAFSPGVKPVDLAGKINADGSVDWVAPAGSWEIYAISQKPSGQKVKRPAPGGEGWMLNPLYPQAVRDWLPWFDAAFKNYHGPKPRAVFQDSYEYRTDWSPDFFAQFEKLRGYQLQDELPALFGTNEDEHAARVKCDYRETVSDIMAEQSEPLWIDWAHQNGFLTRYQAHGSPANWLDLYADADIPETEMFHTDRNKLISKFASSAAHVAGHQLTSAETGTWLAEHFTVTLGDLKGLADDMFLSGVNHIVYHGLCYSPDAAGWPGWLFYASTEMNPRNSIWHDVPALNEYIARCQAVLQSGKPDNDILLYWPIEDFWMQPGDKLLPQLTVHARAWFEEQPIGRTAKGLWDKGYSFDYVSDAQLQTAKVAEGKIRMPGGKYHVILVPECKYIPLETFKQLLALAQNGATVVFEKQLPADVSGLGNLKQRRRWFQRQKMKLNEVMENKPSGKNFGKGSVTLDSAGHFLGLRQAGIPHETMADAGLSFVRRTFDGGWNYFIANRGTNNFDGWITLSRPAQSVAVLNPMTGSSGVAARNADRQIHLQLAAGQSVILRAFADKKVEGPAWIDWRASGQPVEITSPWSVKFISGGPTLPPGVQITKLASWTTFPDTNTEVFAGTAKYETTFDAPDSAGKHFEINLGDVRQSARVRVNGKDYGTLIAPPFRVVVDNLKPKGNVLAVEVTSVDANRIRDLDRRGVKWKTFHDANFVNINYKPFDASNWPLTECGLLGPVTLTPVAVAAE